MTARSLRHRAVGTVNLSPDAEKGPVGGGYQPFLKTLQSLEGGFRS
jgi:hypothetical protein